MPAFDFVIIGSGLGGLECGYILAKEGKSVCVLEKNRQFGGTLQIFSRDKAIFDAGVHYIGGLMPGQVLHRFFEYFNLNEKLNLKRLDEDCFDQISFGHSGERFSLAQDKANFKEQLLKHFPKEEKALEHYLKDITEVGKQAAFHNLDINPGDFELSSAHQLSIGDYLDGLTSNSKLKSVLAGNNLLYAGNPNKTPFYVHSIIEDSYIESAWKCVDGSGQIAKHLVEGIRNFGGEVRNYSEVKSIETTNGKACAVVLSCGERLACMNIVANIHPIELFKMLNPGTLRPAYTNRVSGLDNSIGAFLLNIVLKPASFPYLNYNIYHHENENVFTTDYQPETWPQTMAIFCPAGKSTGEFAESLTVMCYLKMEEVKDWEGSFRTIPKHEQSRGEGYEEFKERKSQQIIAKLETVFPQIRGLIKSYSAQTPLTYRDYLATPNGSMYGITMDSQSPMKYVLSSRQRIENIFLSGQNLNLHGVLGVTVSAVVTCSDILGKDYLLPKFRKGN